MKAYLIPIFLFFLPLFGHSQEISDSTTIALTTSTCNCIESKDLESLSSSAVEMELGLCMMQAISDYKGEDLKIDLSNEASMYQLGEKIGLRMAVECPTQLMKIVDVEDIQAEMGESSITGTLKKIEEGDFSFLVIENEEGRIFKLLWLQYFIGSDALITNPKDVLRKQVTVYYQPIECYSSQLKEYVNKNTITKLIINP